MANKSKKVTLVPVLDIHAEDRVRAVDAMAVEELARDIEEVGLRQPVELRKVPHRDNRIELISGAHRYAAYLMLGRADIPAFFVTCSDADAGMMELDENLIRKDLSVLDRAMFLARKKTLYEAKYPETKRGKPGAFAKHNSANEIISFAASSAATLDCSERKIQLLIAAAEGLSQSDYAQLSTAPRKVTLDDLLTLAKITDPATRAHVIEALAYGDVQNAKAALAALEGPPPAKPDAGKPTLKLVNASFKKAPKKVQMAFVKSNRKLLTALLGELE